MAHEFYLKFDDPGWYAANKDRLAWLLISAPSFCLQVSETEYWLRSSNSDGRWSCDVRVFLDLSGVLVEVTNFGDAFFRDVRALLHSLSKEVPVHLVDDDGVAIRWPN